MTAQIKARQKPSASKRRLDEYSRTLKLLHKGLDEGLGKISKDDESKLNTAPPYAQIKPEHVKKSRASIWAVIKHLENRPQKPGPAPQLKRLFKDTGVEPAAFDIAITALFRTEKIYDLCREEESNKPDIKKFSAIKGLYRELGFTNRNDLPTSLVLLQNQALFQR